jgi:competence protein ComEC
VKDPLVGPLAAIAAGILVSRYVPFHSSEPLGAIGAFIALGAFAVWRGFRLGAGICALAGLFFAGILVDVANAPAPAPELDATGREIVIIEGCVVEPPAVSGERERFVLELEPHARAQVTLYTRNGESLPRLRYGQWIEADARVRRPHNFGNPGAFDYARYLARQEIYWTASAAAGSLRVLPGHCGWFLAKAIMDLRAAALERLAHLYEGDSYATGMMQAILIGQSFQLQKVWTAEYRSTGTFHALVISGTHVAVLAAVFLFLLRICFIPEGAALLLTVLAAWLYAAITGWQAPCIRSAAGLTLFMIGGYFYRQRRIMNLLAAVALGFLLFDPEQLFDASFQLTFLAVGFLGAFAAPLIQATSGPLAHGIANLTDTGRDLSLPPRAAQFRIEMRLLAETLHLAAHLPKAVARFLVTFSARVLLFVYEIVAMSAIVQIGLTLPMVVYFHRVGFSGLSANALVVPLMGLVVPIGFAAVITGWRWVALAAGKLLWLSQIVVAWHASIEPGWRIPTPPIWLGIGLAACLIATAAARGWWRTAAGCIAAALLILLVWHPFAAQFHRDELELTTIDVGQGDSLLVTAPDGMMMIVDGGGIPNFGQVGRTQLDIGEDVVAPYLWSRSIRRVDVVVLSHAHEDHIGGLAALIADFRPRELWTGAVPDCAAWRSLRATAVRLGVRVVPLAEGRALSLGNVPVEVLAPPADYSLGATPKNNDSLVLQLRYGRHAFLLSGDVERTIEHAMLGAGELRHADVLKVAHHGSKTSSTDEFLDAVRPEFALVSAGLDNSYGHPNRDTLERLCERHASVLRTDQDGLITIRSDGRRLVVDTNRWHGEALRLIGPF